MHCTSGSARPAVVVEQEGAVAGEGAEKVPATGASPDVSRGGRKGDREATHVVALTRTTLTHAVRLEGPHLLGLSACRCTAQWQAVFLLSCVVLGV